MNCLTKSQLEYHLGRRITEPERMALALAKLRDKPAEFNRIILGRTLWSKQIEVCNSVVRYPTTLVPAGRAVGKSFLLAGIVLWWLYTRRYSLIITTGPSHRHVITVLWKEIKRAIKNAAIPLAFEHLSEGFGSTQRLEIERGSDWCALGYAAGSGEGMSGQHAGQQLVIVDESTGIDDSIWAAIDGLAATRRLFVGNPIIYECRFRELHEKAEAGSPSINSITISSEESPDADKEVSEVGMASRSFLREMAEIHGIHSPWWRSNIRGLFPGQESVQFIPTAWVDACIDESTLSDPLWVDHYESDPIMSIDVGGGVGADPSVIMCRTNKRLLDIFCSEWHGVLDDAKFRIEPEIIARCQKYKIPGSRVTFDQAGVGRSLGSYLAAAPYNLHDTVGYFGAGHGGRRWVNRRSACAYALKDRLDPSRRDFVPFYCGNLPLWPELRKELVAVRDAPMEIQEGQVKQRVEEKKSLSLRLHHSSNLFDALIQSFSYLD